MIGMAAAGWRGRGRGGRWATEALMLGRAPVELVLSRALRRVARTRPEVFERLGPWREAAMVVAPDDLPVGFRLQPDGERGAVRVVRKDDATAPHEPVAVRSAVRHGGTHANDRFGVRRCPIESCLTADAAHRSECLPEKSKPGKRQVAQDPCLSLRPADQRPWRQNGRRQAG